MKSLNRCLLAGALLIQSTLSFASPCGGPGLPPCDVPEPSTLPLLIAGLVGGWVVARLFKK